MKRIQRTQCMLALMVIFMLFSISHNLSNAVAVSDNDLTCNMIMDDNSAFHATSGTKDAVIRSSSSSFTVSETGWYIITVEMDVSAVNTTASHDLRLDGQPVQTIAFNSAYRTINTSFAAYITNDTTHEITIPSPHVMVTSVNVVAAPTITSSTMTTFIHELDFLYINTTLSFVFFVESSANVTLIWSPIGSLSIFEVRLDETLIDVNSFNGILRNLAADVPHNLTFKISGSRDFLGRPPGFKLKLTTLDESSQRYVLPVQDNGWYIVTVEMDVSALSVARTHYLQLDGQPVQAIKFNNAGTTTTTTFAAYLTAGTHEITLSEVVTEIKSASTTTAPTITGATMTTFTHEVNFSSITTNLSFVFFVEPSANVALAWEVNGTLSILEVRLDGTLIDVDSFDGALRNLAVGVPHNLTVEVSGREDSLEGFPGFTLILETLDDSPPQISNFSYAKGPTVDEKLFNVTITFELTDDLSGVLPDSITVKYLTHHLGTGGDAVTGWYAVNRTATFLSKSNDNTTFQFVIPSLKVSIDKIIVYIQAVDARLNKMEVKKDISLGTTSTATNGGGVIPGFMTTVTLAALVTFSISTLLARRRNRRN